MGGDRRCTVGDRQAQRKFYHAVDFGVHGQYSRANAERFKEAIVRHVSDPATIAIRGTYNRGAGGGFPVDFYLEPRQRLVVVVNLRGEFVTGFRMTVQQTEAVQRTGRLGGGA